MKLLTSLLILGLSTLCFSQQIKVKVSQLESNKGKLIVGLFNSEEDFLKDAYKSIVTGIKDQAATVTFSDIPPGVYAISIIHDINENGELETNFMGIPKEPVAVSGTVKAKYGPPKFEDAKFELKAGESLVQNIVFE